MNVITILLDTLRRDHLGCYGNEWIRTPTIDALARRSTVFEKAYVASYPCMPNRRDIWTGRYEFPWRGWGRLEPTDIDFPSVLKLADRVSMLVTDHFHLWRAGSGNYHWNFGGFELIRGQESDNWKTGRSIEPRYPAAPDKLAQHLPRHHVEQYLRNIAGRTEEQDWFFPQVAQRAIEWLDQNHGQKDFCLFIDSFDPHEAWDPPRKYWEPYDPGYNGEDITWPSYGAADRYARAELRHIRALYAGKLTMVDTWLAKLMARVEELGLMDNTVIILTTDHGIMLGEHNVIGKPSTNFPDSNLYEELVHVPLLVYVPNAPPGRCAELVQPVDLFATILDACGVSPPEGSHGASLLRLAGGDGPWSRTHAWWGRFGEAIGITDGRWVLLKWPDGDRNEPLYWYSRTPPEWTPFYTFIGPPELDRFPIGVKRGQRASALYDMATDPAQERDLSRERPDELARLCRALAAQLRAVGAPDEQLDRLGLRDA